MGQSTWGVFARLYLEMEMFVLLLGILSFLEQSLLVSASQLQCPCVKVVTGTPDPSLDGTYILLEEADPEDVDCANHCIYNKQGDSEEDIYCFRQVPIADAANIESQPECPATPNSLVTAFTSASFHTAGTEASVERGKTNFVEYDTTTVIDDEFQTTTVLYPTVTGGIGQTMDVTSNVIVEESTVTNVEATGAVPAETSTRSTSEEGGDKNTSGASSSQETLGSTNIQNNMQTTESVNPGTASLTLPYKTSSMVSESSMQSTERIEGQHPIETTTSVDGEEGTPKLSSTEGQHTIETTTSVDGEEGTPKLSSTGGQHTMETTTSVDGEEGTPKFSSTEGQHTIETTASVNEPTIYISTMSSPILTTSDGLAAKKAALTSQQNSLQEKYVAATSFETSIDTVADILESLTSTGRRKREEEGSKSRAKRALSVPTTCATVLLYAQNSQLTSSSTAADMVTAYSYALALSQIDVASIKADSPCSELEKTQINEQKSKLETTTKTNLETLVITIQIDINGVIQLIADFNVILAEEGYTVIVVVYETFVFSSTSVVQKQTKFTTTPAPQT